LGPNQTIEVHINFSTMECDFSKLVVDVQDLRVRESILAREYSLNRVRILEST